MPCTRNSAGISASARWWSSPCSSAPTTCIRASSRPSRSIRSPPEVSLMARPVIVIEDDPFTRVIQLVLDPQTGAERRAAFADFFAHDEPDFAGWCARLRAKIPALAPAEVRMAYSQAELRAHLAGADAVVVESLRVGREELDAAGRLQLVQKYGALLRN